MTRAFDALRSATRRPMPTPSPRRRALAPRRAPGRAVRGADAAAPVPRRRADRSPPPRPAPQPVAEPRQVDAGADAPPSRRAAADAPAPRARRRRRTPAAPPRRRSTGRASPPRGGAAAVAAGRAQRRRRQSAVRVRAPLLDRLVNQAGEVSITRSRIESDVGQIKGSLGDLTDNLERLRAPAARHRAAGRDADDLAHGGRQGRVAVLRSARVRPLHALPGTDADDGRVGQRRRHRAAHAAAHAASRPKTSWPRRRA